MTKDLELTSHRTLDRIGFPTLPSVIVRAGPRAAKRFVEFFTANIRNRNTRVAYAHAVGEFLSWCERQKLSLDDVEPVVVATYIEDLTNRFEAPTVKQHLAAIRMLFDWLVIGQVVPMNVDRALK